MQISTDELVLFKSGFIEINSTLLYSWIVMTILIGISIILRRKFVFDVKKADKITNSQLCLETLIKTVDNQIRGMTTRGIGVVFPL